jgi:hypothetical protein
MSKCKHQWATILKEDKTPSKVLICIYCLKEKKQTRLKKYGKWGLYSFLAYQVVGLIVLALNFDTIWSESIKAGETIAGQIVGN